MKNYIDGWKISRIMTNDGDKCINCGKDYFVEETILPNGKLGCSCNTVFPEIDKMSWFYKNCKKQRKNNAKICQVCPFRFGIESQE